MSPHYALFEKIPHEYKVAAWGKNEPYYHWRTLAIFPTIEAVREGFNIWRYSFGYDSEILDYQEVPSWVQVNRTYTLREIHEIKWDALHQEYGYAARGKTGPGPALGSLLNVRSAPDMGTGAKVKKDGSSLIAEDEYTRDYEIIPEKGMITIYRRLRDESDQMVRAGIVAKVDGYPGKTGITRARREAQYLIDEPDTAQNRINSGMYPVITPGSIVQYRAVRPEMALVSEGVPA